MIIRLAKIVMTAALAAFAFIVTYDNLVDYGSNYAFVKHVLSMDTTFPGNALLGPGYRRSAPLERRLCGDHHRRGPDICAPAGRIRCHADRRSATCGTFSARQGLDGGGCHHGLVVWFGGFLIFVNQPDRNLEMTPL